MVTNLFLPALLNYLNLFPLLLVWIAGIVIAIFFWRKHPVVSMLVVIAMGTLLIERFVRIYMSYWIPYQVNHYRLSAPQSTFLGRSVNLIEALINAGAWSIVLIALFGWRKSSGLVAE
jgi:hypothetical protein